MSSKKSKLAFPRAMAVLAVLFAPPLFLSCKSESVSTVKGNGSVVDDPSGSATVLVRMSNGGTCTGSVINRTAQILTAAHCVVSIVQGANGAWQVSIDRRVSVTVKGKVVNATNVAPNQNYVNAANEAIKNAAKGARPQLDARASASYDEAILTLPYGTEIPGVHPVSDTGFQPGDQATISGFGKLAVSLDEDQDGVVDYINNRLNDMCSLPPNGKPVHKSGQYIGCAQGQTRDNGRHFKNPGSSGVLREGDNTVAGTGNGTVDINGPLVASAQPGQTITAPGDSGGPILNQDGKIGAIVSGGSISDDGKTDLGFNNDVTDPDSAEFIKKQTAPCYCGLSSGYCMVWRPGDKNPVAYVQSSTCDANTCRTNSKLAAAIVNYCGGAWKLYK